MMPSVRVRPASATATAARPNSLISLPTTSRRTTSPSLDRRRRRRKRTPCELTLFVSVSRPWCLLVLLIVSASHCLALNAEAAPIEARLVVGWNDDSKSPFPESLDSLHSRHSRAIGEADGSGDDAPAEANADANLGQRVLATRLPAVSKGVSYADDGHITVLAGKQLTLDLFGFGLKEGAAVKLTTARSTLGGPCKSDSSHSQTRVFDLDSVSSDGSTASVIFPADELRVYDDGNFFLCLRSSKDGDFVHQGTETATMVSVYEHPLPIWIMIILLVVLLCLSGLFSGLNLGLMALDQTELKIVQNTGTEKERNYANKIAPIRAHGNFLLCSLLLGNVLVNNTLTILLDTLTSGLVAVIGATMGIVVFGEIIPQAICSRHGLAVGAYTIFLTKFFMLLTFPLSYPISKILDKVLGAEIGTVYDKKKLIELLRVTHNRNDLVKEEVDIVTGALVYKDKTVKDVMTQLEDVYMLPLDSVLDFDTLKDIQEQGYSRIPVYSGDIRNIVHVLFAKDLLFVDPDEGHKMSVQCDFYQNEVNFVFEDTRLDVMLNDFKTGKSHMAFVQKINNEGDGDPYYETIGLVTLEDIIEEIIQQEIVDETDVVLDNRTKKRRKRHGRPGQELQLAEERKQRVAISQQQIMAVFQYLTTSIEPFTRAYINQTVLKTLLRLDVFREVKIKKGKNKTSEEDLIIIEKGKPVDYFVLIVEGRVQVNIGQEELVFDSGPFTYFCIQSLAKVIEATPNSPIMSRVVTTPSALPSSNSAAVAETLQHQQQQQQQQANGTKGNLRKASTTIDTTAVVAVAGPGNATKHMPPRQTSSVFNNKKFENLFVPDYTVKATTDVLYLRIKMATYQAMIKASRMSKMAGTDGTGELQLSELDHYLERVHEQEDDDESSMVMMRLPSLQRSQEEKAVIAAAVAAGSISTNIAGSAGSPASIKKAPAKDTEKEPLTQPPATQETEFWTDENNSSVDVASVAIIGGRDGGESGGGGASNNGPPSLPCSVVDVKASNGGGGANQGGNDRTSFALNEDDSLMDKSS